MSEAKAPRPIKLLLIGDSKAGKTGALASLLESGFSLRIVDLDNGTDILRGLLRKKPEALGRLRVRTCTDSFSRKRGPNGTLRLLPDGSSWTKAMDALNEWPEFGPIESWDSSAVLVIDSLSFLAQAALNHVLLINNRLGEATKDMDIGTAQKMIREVLDFVYNDGLKCHVVVITHIDYRGGQLTETKSTASRPAPTPDHIDLLQEKGYPLTLGKALNPVIGRYFNSLFLVKSIGMGAQTKRVICTANATSGTASIDLSSVSPDLPRELPIETGLATYFQDLGWKPQEEAILTPEKPK